MESVTKGTTATGMTARDAFYTLFEVRDGSYLELRTGIKDFCTIEEALAERNTYYHEDYEASIRGSEDPMSFEEYMVAPDHQYAIVVTDIHRIVV